MSNQKVDADVRWVVRGAVNWAVDNAASAAVNWAVGGAVYWAVAGAVVEVVKKDSEHPAPLDFLREARL